MREIINGRIFLEKIQRNYNKLAGSNILEKNKNLFRNG